MHHNSLIRSFTRRVAWLGVVVVSQTTACTGVIGDGTGSGGDGTGPGTGNAAGGSGGSGQSTPPQDPTGTAKPSTWRPGMSDADPNAAGLMPLRGLSREEYNNTVRDLLGDDRRLASEFSGESTAAGFATMAPVSDQAVKALQDYAHALADAADLSALAPCAEGVSDEAACAQEFIASFGRRAFRRPLTDAEIAEYIEFQGPTLRGLGFSFEESLRGVIAAMLQSPFFIYHWELGAEPPSLAGSVIQLGPHELAARLSYFLWSSVPDVELSSAADAGLLRDAAEVEEHARRMLNGQRAQDTLRTFTLQWLHIDDLSSAVKSPDRYPSYSGEVAAAMQAELVTFTNSVVFSTASSFPSLLESPLGFVNSALAPVYGVQGVTGSDLSPVTLNAVERPGLFTRAGFLMSTANAYEGDPTKRGVFIREQVLCQPLEPPPMNIPPLPPPSPNLTVRERHEQHFADPACSGCHAFTDLIGFGFSNFDAIGGFQTTEVGKPVDATGEVVNIDGSDVPFSDVAGLASILSASPEVRACWTKQWLRFAFRRMESQADDYSLDQAYRAFEQSNWNIRELLVAMATSRSFMCRAPAEGEVTR